MTYQEAREFIDSSNMYGSKLGLTTISQLLQRLDNPQDKLKVIHVAGTNGKGSTAAYISSVLASEGYRVGRYVSPAVFSYRERIQINTDYITEQGIGDAIDIIKPVCEAMVRDGFDHLTSFEIETAMAFLFFEREQVDFAVIEVGLGGRLDATNVIKQPVCSVITSVSMDHMQFLGDTLKKIAREKAGIIKDGRPVITGNSNTTVLNVIKEVCKAHDSRLITPLDLCKDSVYTPEGTKFCYGNQDFEIKLLGEYQVDNAVLAIEAVRELQRSGYQISDNGISKGLLQAKWSGRLEVIARNPYFIIDGAHNEDAAIQLRNAMQKVFPDKRMIFIMGVLADKDYRQILKITAPLASVIITITPNNSRALNCELLADEARQFTEGEVLTAPSISKAVSFAYEQAGRDDLILAFGSLSYLSDVIDEIRSRNLT